MQNIENDSKPPHENYIDRYNAAQRTVAYEIHNYAAERKVRITFNKNKGMIYHHKSKMLLKFGRTRGFEVSVTVKDKSNPYTVVEEKLTKESKEIQQQSLPYMHGCATCRNSKGDGCSSESSGKFIDVLGNRHEMCNTEIIAFNWHEPTLDDLPLIKRLIDIRCEIITEVTAAKKGMK
jgi:hypothetical protein